MTAGPHSLVVLDTNVVSELMRPEPAERVRDWALAAPPASIHTTSVTVAEVRYGIARLPTGRRRTSLAAVADEVFAVFADRVLPFDAAAAERYADVVAERDRSGAPIAAFDAQIAAVCRLHGATLATRNTGDFAGTGINLLDPWGPL